MLSPRTAAIVVLGWGMLWMCRAAVPAAMRAHLRAQVAKLRVLHQGYAAKASEKEELITLKNTQRKYLINTEQVKADITAIQRVLGVADFRVSVWFCSDDKIRDLNDDWREKRKATDVLSFPANEFRTPGVLDGAARASGHLGDIVISPGYVQRVCDRDREEFTRAQEVAPGGVGTDGADKDAGVSLAMSSCFNLEERLPLLLVHSLLHLVGYDHETEQDWRLMTHKEQEILDALGWGRAVEQRAPAAQVSPSLAGTAASPVKAASIEHCKS